MTTRRRTEIVFERERTIICTDRYPRRVLHCARCDAEVEMITVFDAARLAGVSSYTIYGWAEAGTLHGHTAPGEPLLICLNSLSQ